MFVPPKMVVCVGAVVLQQARVLLVRQTYGVYKGRWTIPWGFVCDEDGMPQPPDVAAVREVQEEAGVTAVITALLGIQNDIVRTGSRDEPWLYVLFQCRHQDGIPTPDGQETDAAVYLSLAEMDSFNGEIEPFSNWLARRVLRGENSVIYESDETIFPPHLAYL
ncbi:MAG: NUDIX hydrolase [Chloroflexi bacterium]|nr:MAG: NUDIX hydrolase [Chloroflexota bacterium]